MHKTLILTGWSKTVYMTAAAAALEALKWKADVAGVSMDALAGELKVGTQLTAGERTRLHEIENVTPGDFRTVRQHLSYLGGEIDNEMRIRAIEQECANKRAFHRERIGF